MPKTTPVPTAIATAASSALRERTKEKDPSNFAAMAERSKPSAIPKIMPMKRMSKSKDILPLTKKLAR